MEFLVKKTRRFYSIQRDCKISKKKKKIKLKKKKKKKNGPQAISSLLESIISPIDILLGTSNLFTS